MPERSRVRWSQLKVGLIGAAAFALVFVLVFLLTSTQGLFQHNAILRTYMGDASGVAEGTPVRLNGISVGYLKEVHLTGSRDPNRTVGFDMLVQEKYLSDIPVDSIAGISAANLLGDKFINITKGTSKQTVKPGAELPSLQARDIPELMAQSANLLQTLQTIVGRLDNLLAGVEQGQGNIGKFLKDEELYTRLTGIVSEGQKLLVDMRTGGGTLSKLIYDDSLYQDIRAPLRRIDTMLADLQNGQGTAGKLLKDPALFDEARESLVEMRGLLADINAGKGTAGKLIKDEELYTRVNELVIKFNGTIDKINSGNGTVGQLMVNPALYDSLSGATREFQSLAKDIRANPKKFLTIRLTLFLRSRKQLVINADDFGLAPDVNAGIVESHLRGVLTSTTIMANGAAFEDAVRLARQTPSLDIGVHLTLIGGPSLLTGDPLPATVPAFLKAYASGRLRAYRELRAQIERALEAGLLPSHLDTHKHTHLAPPVLDAVARLSREFGIRWVRRPFDFPLSGSPAPALVRLTSCSLRFLRRRFHAVLEANGCRTTDHFSGFQMTGRFDTADLVALLDALPEGSTEFMTHPGRCGEYLRGMRTRLKESRDRELRALVSSEVREALERNGIELAPFTRLD